MKSKTVSIVLSLVMVVSISASMAKNVGELCSNSGGAGGLADSPETMFQGNLNSSEFTPLEINEYKEKLNKDTPTGNCMHSPPTISSNIMNNVGINSDNPDASKTQNHLLSTAMGLDQFVNEGDIVTLGSSIEYHCIFQVPSDVIIITSTYSTGAGSLSYLIRNGGILSAGGSNNYFVESGGSIENSGGSCNVYLKSGASFKADGSGSHKIYYEPGANIINPGNGPTLIPCPKMKFEGVDPDENNIVFYEWDFESDGVFDYQETSSNASDGNFDGETTHIYGDNGFFSVTLRITDDNGVSGTEIWTVIVRNVKPYIDNLTPLIVNESDSFNLSVRVTDPGSDDLILTWGWSSTGFSDTINIYLNDPPNSDPQPSPEINLMNITDIVSQTYGDNGVFRVRLKVEDDDGGSSYALTEVTVNNVDPTLEIESAVMNVEVGLRIAGKKYNNVSMTLSENEKIVGYVSIERMPGSPNDQMAWIPVSLDMQKSYSATVTFTPEDPPKVGANPVWIYIKSENGSINKIHHTFNVQQSKKRDSDHWNHVEPWEVDLNVHLMGHEFEITSHVTDPGSDDETLTFTYGSQVKIVAYLNNPPNPDPYPSPEVKPMDITDTTTLVYEGVGTVMLHVEDDDSGFDEKTLDIT